MESGSVLIMASVRWYNASAHYALFLAEGLKKSGIDVFVLGIPGSPFINKAKGKGIKVIENINLSNSGFLKYLKHIFAFRRFIKSGDIRILNPHISNDHTFAFLSLIGKRIKIVRTRTSSIPPKNNIFNKYFYKNAASHYIVSSEYMTSHITGMGVQKRNISVIPLGNNYKEFAVYKPNENQKSKFDIPANKLIVLFAGRLDTIKGVEYFIKSFSYLKQKEKFYFLISGEEINLSKNYLKKLADDFKISNLTIIDRVNDIRDVLSIADIGVIPSIGSESICRIGLEMLSFGIPIVGSNINSIPELISRFGGIIVKPGSPEEIAKALDYLAVPANYKKMQKKIRSEIAKQNPDRFALEHIEVFTKALEIV
jgi:glycosyltransferase involved in cell wall biosynthesis